MLVERFRRWLVYEGEMHAKTIASLESVPHSRRASGEFQRALAILGHLIAARRVWLYRLGVAPTPPESLFPSEVHLSELVSDWESVESSWRGYLETLTDEDLAKAFEYQSLDAGRFRNTIEDVLTQLFTHGAYHRGQIAMLVKAAGGQPAVTDYIYWRRQAIP